MEALISKTTSPRMGIRWGKRNYKRPRKPWVGRPWRNSICPRTRWNIFGRRFPAARKWRTSGGRSSTRTSRRFRRKPPSSSSIVSGRLPQNWSADLPKWKPTDKPIATRAAGGEAINALAKHIPNLIGGSADLNPSTRTALKGLGDFQSPECVGAGNAGRSRRGVELCRAEHCFRCSRARHGSCREWNGRTRRCASLQRNVFHIFRLHEACHPTGSIESSQSDLRFHARQHRTRGGWPDSPANRATRRLAWTSGAYGHPSRRPERNRGSVGFCSST